MLISRRRVNQMPPSTSVVEASILCAFSSCLRHLSPSPRWDYTRQPHPSISTTPLACPHARPCLCPPSPPSLGPSPLKRSPEPKQNPEQKLQMKTYRDPQIILPAQPFLTLNHIADPDDVVARGVDVFLHGPGAVEHEYQVTFMISTRCQEG